MGKTGHSADSWKYGGDIGAPPSFQKIMDTEKSSGIAITSQSSGFTGALGKGSGHVSNSYHYWGNAVDASSSAGNMIKLAQWIYQNFWASTLELIHSGGGGFFVHNGVKVSGSYYGATLVSQHYNHVHWAITMSGLAAGPAASGGAANPTGAPGTVSQATATQAAQVNAITQTPPGCGNTTAAGLILLAGLPLWVHQSIQFVGALDASIHHG